MPRFDNEGFNPNRRIDNDKRDRTVPTDENYYGESVDLNFNSKRKGDETNPYPYGTDGYNTQNGNGYGDLRPPQPPIYDRQAQNEYNSYNSYNSEPERRQSRQNQSAPRPQRGKTPKNKPPKRAKKRKINKAGAIFAAIVAIILVIALVAVGMVNQTLGRINYDQKVENKYVNSAELKHDDAVKNILLLGVDARANQDKESSRADSMMLISVDTKNKCIKTVSFLRDTWVYIPCRDKKQRLNAACTYGGYSGVVDTIEYNFGVDIDGYVVTDFEMFKVLVDSIGGVEVEVTEKEAKEVTSHPKRYGNVKLKAGKYKLTGEQALAYCRIRKIDTDFMRAKRQRTVIQSIIKNAKSASPTTLYKMVYNSAPYIETSFTKSELKKIAISAVQCIKSDMVQDKVPFEGTWKYAKISGASVISIDVDKNKAKLIDFIYNKTPEQIKAEQKDK